MRSCAWTFSFRLSFLVGQHPPPQGLFVIHYILRNGLLKDEKGPLYLEKHRWILIAGVHPTSTPLMHSLMTETGEVLKVFLFFPDLLRSYHVSSLWNLTVTHIYQL